MQGDARRSFWLLPFLLAPLLFLPLQGNIGDSLDQLRTHFGSALGASSPYLFQHEGFSISVYLDGDHAAMEIFMRDNSIPEQKDFSGDNIKEFLTQEGNGQKWNNFASKNGHPVWVREDNKLVAIFNPDQKVLTVMLNAK